MMIKIVRGFPHDLIHMTWQGFVSTWSGAYTSLKIWSHAVLKVLLYHMFNIIVVSLKTLTRDTCLIEWCKNFRAPNHWFNGLLCTVSLIRCPKQLICVRVMIRCELFVSFFDFHYFRLSRGHIHVTTLVNVPR